MLCPSSSPAWGTGSAGTLNDGVGTGLCGDVAESIALAATIAAVAATAVVTRRLPLTAAATLAAVSAYHLVFGENVIYYTGTSAHSRQVGTPVVTGLLSLIFWCSTPPRCASAVASIASSGYVSWAVAAAVRHPLDRASDEYTAFDAAGVAVAGLWWWAARNTPGDDAAADGRSLVG